MDLAGYATVAGFVVLLALLWGFDRSLYRPWIRARVLRKRAEERAHEQWIAQLQRINDEFRPLTDAMRRLGTAFQTVTPAMQRFGAAMKEVADAVSAGTET